MIKYLLYFIIGILIFLIINYYEGFNIGVPFKLGKLVYNSSVNPHAGRNNRLSHVSDITRFDQNLIFETTDDLREYFIMYGFTPGDLVVCDGTTIEEVEGEVTYTPDIEIEVREAYTRLRQIEEATPPEENPSEQETPTPVQEPEHNIEPVEPAPEPEVLAEASKQESTRASLCMEDDMKAIKDKLKDKFPSISKRQIKNLMKAIRKKYIEHEIGIQRRNEMELSVRRNACVTLLSNWKEVLPTNTRVKSIDGTRYMDIEDYFDPNTPTPYLPELEEEVLEKISKFVELDTGLYVTIINSMLDQLYSIFEQGTNTRGYNTRDTGNYDFALNTLLMDIDDFFLKIVNSMLESFLPSNILTTVVDDVFYNLFDLVYNALGSSRYSPYIEGWETIEDIIHDSENLEKILKLMLERGLRFERTNARIDRTYADVITIIISGPTPVEREVIEVRSEVRGFQGHLGYALIRIIDDLFNKYFRGTLRRRRLPDPG